MIDKKKVAIQIGSIIFIYYAIMVFISGEPNLYLLDWLYKAIIVCGLMLIILIWALFHNTNNFKSLYK